MKIKPIALISVFFSAGAVAQDEPGTIVDVAIDDGSFSYFIASLDATALGMIEILEGEGPFTLFIPTDEAFEALPEDTLENWLEDGKMLADIVSYHWIDTELSSDSFNDYDTDMPTLSGDFLEFSFINDETWINGEARIVRPDIRASNGYIHAIDKVLVPQSDD